jgi:hypothetical protein
VNDAVGDFGMHFSAMGRHQFLDDGQADAGAAMVAGS